MNQAARPRDAGLLHMRLPVGAVTSILHRMTGALLIPLVAAVLALLHKALVSARSYDMVRAVLAGSPGHLLGPVCMWIVAHHTYGGIRHLALDAGLVRGRRAARWSAMVVLAAAVCTGLLAAILWP